MNGRAISRLVLFALFATAGIARADEIRLKDGTKINGTIVGYENDSFKVETAYGFALVRKDKVAEIIPSAPAKESEPKAKPEPPVPPLAPAPPSVAPATPKTPADAPAAVNKSTAKPETTKAAATSAKNAPNSEKQNATSVCPEGAICDGEVPGGGTLPHPSISPVSIEPPVIRDEIRGNLYVNLTYGFQMYKPPSWDLIPGASTALPNAVAALGTNDETTLLVIGREGREHAKDSPKESLDTYAAATEKALSEVYDNYRPISGRRTMVGQSSAVERRFRGTADGHDWSVILLTFAHGNDFFTLLGMTWADSDLIQVQENVIAKAVNSLTFTAQ